jgi:hypothetical protein
MSEFTCRCGEIMTPGEPCPECGAKHAYRMDGRTNREIEAREYYDAKREKDEDE